MIVYNMKQDVARVSRKGFLDTPVNIPITFCATMTYFHFISCKASIVFKTLIYIIKDESKLLVSASTKPQPAKQQQQYIGLRRITYGQSDHLRQLRVSQTRRYPQRKKTAESRSSASGRIPRSRYRGLLLLLPQIRHRQQHHGRSELWDRQTMLRGGRLPALRLLLILPQTISTQVLHRLPKQRRSEKTWVAGISGLARFWIQAAP
ncbi:hypothetical protein BX667DRAFT_184975 [Coemansia mojavensis]|nr:hypothetical protein BX667DRAFT_184975 [Coemansia mojavensis]